MSPDPTPQGPAPAPVDRWDVIRDVLVFQVKLGVDALRDVVLSPISIGAAVIDLLRGDGRERPLFYEVLALGRRSERWINLFGEAERIAPRTADAAAVGEGERASLDRLVGRVEALVVEQYERGGVTAQAKATIDRSLDALRPKRPAPAPDEGDAPAG